jgi:hypothetical protein
VHERWSRSDQTILICGKSSQLRIPPIVISPSTPFEVENLRVFFTKCRP